MTITTYETLEDYVTYNPSLLERRGYPKTPEEQDIMFGELYDWLDTIGGGR
jgi:hypothetical protein